MKYTGNEEQWYMCEELTAEFFEEVYGRQALRLAKLNAYDNVLWVKQSQMVIIANPTTGGSA